MIPAHIHLKSFVGTLAHLVIITVDDSNCYSILPVFNYVCFSINETTPPYTLTTDLFSLLKRQHKTITIKEDEQQQHKLRESTISAECAAKQQKMKMENAIGLVFTRF